MLWIQVYEAPAPVPSPSAPQLDPRASPSTPQYTITSPEPLWYIQVQGLSEEIGRDDLVALFGNVVESGAQVAVCKGQRGRECGRAFLQVKKSKVKDAVALSGTIIKNHKVTVKQVRQGKARKALGLA